MMYEKILSIETLDQHLIFGKYNHIHSDYDVRFPYFRQEKNIILL
jgi:hypothetical protein